MLKRILILANSVKKGGFCVAGREIVGIGGNEFGDWIRPVSRRAEGELQFNHCLLQQGGLPRELDVVDIPLHQQQADPGQPENWLIDDTQKWSRVGTVKIDDIGQLIERPDDLWWEWDGSLRSDRISAISQCQMTPQTSIVLIRPKNFRVRMWREYNDFKGRVQPKTRAVFEYNEMEYALSITDPIFTRKYCQNQPKENEPAIESDSPYGDQCLLCVSLTPPFNGYHYKVVATVLELP